MNEGDKQNLKDLLEALKYITLYVAAIAMIVAMCSCSSTSKVVTDTTQRAHIEQTADSIAHIARRDSIVTTNVNAGKTVNNITNREHWHELHDSTIVTINPDGSKNTRTVRSEKEKEAIHDTLWRDRWRDSVRTEFVYVLDSMRVASYQSRIDSLTHELRDKEVVIKELSFWDKIKQSIFGGIVCVFIAAVVWMWMKVVRH